MVTIGDPHLRMKPWLRVNPLCLPNQPAGHLGRVLARPRPARLTQLLRINTIFSCDMSRIVYGMPPVP